LILYFNGAGDELERVAALAAQFQRPYPESGHAPVINFGDYKTLDGGVWALRIDWGAAIASTCPVGRLVTSAQPSACTAGGTAQV